MEKHEIEDICEAVEITINHLEGDTAISMPRERRVQLLREALILLRKLLDD
jgi:hypothetical protein